MANDKIGGQQTLYMAEGMIGACPVFKTREQAETFADGSCGVVEFSILQSNARVSGGAV